MVTTPRPARYAEDAARERAAATLPHWQDVYGRFFPDLVDLELVAPNTPRQLRGIDRVAHLADGRVVAVQEKYRWKDYGDCLLEYAHSDGRRGWVTEATGAEWTLYAIMPARQAIFLPTPLLHGAWRQQGEDWWALARAELEGFRHSAVPNRNPQGKPYRSLNVALPWERLWQGIAAAATVTW